MKETLLVLGTLGIVGAVAFVWMGYQHKQAALNPPPQPRSNGPMDSVLALASGTSVALAGILGDKRVQGGIAAGAGALGSAVGSGLSSALGSL